MYAGGADTVSSDDDMSLKDSLTKTLLQSVSVMATFFLAMALHPLVARRAQEEVDSVIGNERLPVLADRERLPYVDAIVKECLRWNVAAPLCKYYLSETNDSHLFCWLALPRATSEDDVYNDKFIPKDSVIFPNVW